MLALQALKQRMTEAQRQALEERRQDPMRRAFDLANQVQRDIADQQAAEDAEQQNDTQVKNSMRASP